jgi:hypothetical protein
LGLILLPTKISQENNASIGTYLGEDNNQRQKESFNYDGKSVIVGGVTNGQDFDQKYLDR